MNRAVKIQPMDIAASVAQWNVIAEKIDKYAGDELVRDENGKFAGKRAITAVA